MTGDRSGICAQRRSDNDLATAGLGPDEKEVRDVRVHDQENHADGAEENPQCLRDFADHVALQRVDAGRKSAALHPRARVRIGHGLGQPHGQARKLRLSCVQRHAPLQTGDCAKLRMRIPKRPGGIETKRKPDISLEERRGRAVRGREIDAGRHDADDLHWLLVNTDRRADDSIVTAEAALPETMRDDCDLGSPRDVVMVVNETAPDCPRAEQLQRVCADLGGARPFRAVWTDQVCTAAAVSTQTVNGVGFAPEEEPRPFRNVPFSSGTDFGYGAFELHEPVRVGVWERIEHDPLQRGIDGCARADAEREGEYGDQREAGALRERAHRVAQIPKQSVHHSALSAIIGSTRAARRAGSQHATSATASNSTATVTKVNGSCGLTPTSSRRTTRVSAGASNSPAPTPSAAGIIPWRTTSRCTVRWSPPKAIRMPARTSAINPSATSSRSEKRYCSMLNASRLPIVC